MHWRERQRRGNHERRFEGSIGLIKGTLFKYVIDVVEEGVEGYDYGEGKARNYEQILSQQNQGCYRNVENGRMEEVASTLREVVDQGESGDER